LDSLMNTEILTTDQTTQKSTTIDRAAQLIRSGRLVAFPTETVYGLGANALDPVAVERIFEAKGRPNSNPVIVHVADSLQVVNVARVWPETAKELAGRFWPGPLTIVVPKLPEVPDVVTAGGPTVALRCPAHPIAQALIRAAGVPIAAPSANRSTELSPTRAEHVWQSLAGRIDLILDGGPCPGGIESTVVDVTGDSVRLLRPGPITARMLEEVVGKVEFAVEKSEGVARSPGQMAKHYSPRTRLRLFSMVDFVDDLLEAFHIGKRVGVVAFSGPDAHLPKMDLINCSWINLTDNPQFAAARLYDTFHKLDQLQLDLILVEEPPDTPEWAAIRDRLKRAAATMS
jgi:L-threonylcarbamoyladenylate synthase